MNATQQLPKKIQITWFVHACANLILSLIILAAIYLAGHAWHWPIWFVYIITTTIALGTISELVSIPYRYRFWQYRITEDAVEMQSGFIFRKRIAIPISRVQNVTLSAGPLLQWQKMQKVTVATASSTHTIDGLDNAKAEKLRDQIMALALGALDHEI
ncbi:PH domain-containing protein [Oenococcus sp.]|uniref:PH domain-containing protein n=1 Tax=Oenococcus sp. TaxID=1979414 RepID=UPI0039ECE534